jgi:16S rRNA pseudouridine516 synthase
MRLDKFISTNTFYSRAQIQLLVRQGLVTINGAKAAKSSVHVGEDDQVHLDSKLITASKPRYLMLNKPAGYVCANTDSEHPTVLDLLDEPFKEKLQIAGRLDLDTTGLVLITDDGDWNHRVTSPRHDHHKLYVVTTVDVIDESAIALFRQGILLHGESKPTLPAELELVDSHSARLKICEGKYHQVKRMFAAVGNRVVALHREGIGDISLGAELPAGSYRSLTADEINSFGKSQ